MRRPFRGFFPASDQIMKKRKTSRMSQDSKTKSPQSAERRNKVERRADDRRAHARFEPGSSTRNDRRRGDRRNDS